MGFSQGRTDVQDIEVSGALSTDPDNKRVAIGGHKDPQATLDVSGSFRATGDMVISGSSTQVGDVTIGGDIILDDGGSLKEAGGTAAITFDGSGHVTKIGQDTHTSGQFLKFDGAKFVLDAASGGGSGATDLDGLSDVSYSSGDLTITSLDKLTTSATAHNAAGQAVLIQAGNTTAGTTNNIAGGSLTLAAGQGKGSGAGGDIIFKTANAGGSGSSLNSLATALTISDDLSSTFSGDVTFGVDDTGVDVRIFSATASEGVLYDASEDELALLLTTKLKFHDVGGGEEIFASSDGHLEINAGTTLDITAPTVDINASTELTIDGSLTVSATDAQTTNGIIGQFNGVDGSGPEVNRLAVNCSSANQDTGISFMDNGSTKWTLGNDGSADDFHIRVGYGLYGVTDEFILNSSGSLTLLNDTASSATQGAALRLVCDDGAAMADDHRLGVIEFAGAEDASNTITVGARIEAICDASWSASENGAALLFYTTDGNASQSEVLRLDSNKLATFAGTIWQNTDGSKLLFGADGEVTLTHVHNTGLLLSDDSGIGTTKLMFGDSACFIQQQADGELGIDADSIINVTAPTVDIDASTAVAIDTDTLTIASANSQDPLVIIKNTTDDANGARLQFVKDKGGAGADGDDIGVIEFVGDDAGQTQTTFAKIVAEVSEADNTDEAGKLSFFVAESDGTTTALTAGLVLEGEHATDGEVDVTIGAGTGSTTTIAGSLDVTHNVHYDSSPADESCSGMTATFTAGEALVRGEVVYFKAADSKMWKAVATAAATSRCVAMAAEDISADASGKFLLKGFLTDNGSFPSYTVGGVLYTPEAETSSENVPEQTAPDTDGDFVQIIGWAVTANTVYFCPDSTVIEVA